MAPSNSHVEFYLDLFVQLIRCDPLQVTSPKDLKKDLETLTSRVQTEGLSFLTKTLPKLGKALDQGLADAQFSVPREFGRSHKNRSIPAFMQAYFNCVFDDSGCLLDEAEPAAVNHLRQVLFFAYKLEIDYSPAAERRVLDSFVETELELEVGGDEETKATIAAASYIIRTVFSGFDPKDIVPRHGPGAVATGERLEEKWVFTRLYSSIHSVYPYYDFYVAGGARELVDRLDWYRSLERLDQGCAKVVLVPKDSRGPRLISCEPLEYQWIQQGLGRKLVQHLESFWMTRGQINFTNQGINRSLALESSLTRTLATIDLKDASDRVSLELVRGVFSQTPSLLRALEATRTTATKLPDGRVITLKKFAPMGSALCFPVEATVFWALIVAAICRKTREQPELVGQCVYVYGDDIIVPVEHVHTAMHALESCGLRVNKTKCCIIGPFRESCGMDAFKGVCVTPTRLRKRWTGRLSDASAYASYISIANDLSSKGYRGASDLLWKELERTYGFIPYGTVRSSFPCRVVGDAVEAEARNLLSNLRCRFSRHFQRIEFQVRRLSSVHLDSKLDGWTRLLRNLVTPGIESPSDVVVPRSTKIKRGWSAVY